jgi:peptidylprolyl isomerase
MRSLRDGNRPLCRNARRGLVARVGRARTQSGHRRNGKARDVDNAAAGVEVAGDLGAKPTITVPEGPPPEDLQIADLVVGDGDEVPAGATVTTNYVGVSWSTGRQFDASWDGHGPISFGLNQVIAGWTDGIPGMRVGGRRLLVIPPHLGYGAAGAGGVIGPNETLVFVIDLEGVN